MHARSEKSHRGILKDPQGFHLTPDLIDIDAIDPAPDQVMQVACRQEGGLRPMPGLPHPLFEVGQTQLRVIGREPDKIVPVTTLFARLKDKKVEFVSDAFEPPAEEAMRIFRKCSFLVANKTDLDPGGENFEALKFFYEAQLPIVPVSAATGAGLEGLRRRIFDLLRVIRAYSKPPGNKVELTDPHVLKRGANVLDIARSVHKDFAEKLAYARLWREGSFNGQMVTRDEVLQDQDVVELHI